MIVLNAFDHYLAKIAAAQAVGDLSATTPKIMLLNGFTIATTSGEFLNTYRASEVSGTNYTAGGLTLAGGVATLDAGNNRAFIDWDDPSWPNVTIANVDGYIIYYNTGTDSTSRVLGGQNFATQSPTGVELKITLATGGVALIG